MAANHASHHRSKIPGPLELPITKRPHPGRLDTLAVLLSSKSHDLMAAYSRIPTQAAGQHESLVLIWTSGGNPLDNREIYGIISNDS